MKTIIDRKKAKGLSVEKRYRTLMNYEKLKILEFIYPLLDDDKFIEEFINDGDLPKLNQRNIYKYHSLKD